jgi:Aerotolerance regulator N-terminal/von Willebrand factor type A domain
MSFLFPAFLIGGVAIAIPIVLHLLRRDVAPEVPFSAVHLLHRSPIERSKRRRLRDLLLLLARVAALVLLAAAFARPYRAGAAPPVPVVIVAVDRSFSMGAPGAFDRARQLAAAAIDDAAGARVAVVAFDERAEVIAPPGTAADARRALDRLTIGFGATRYAPVVARAAEVAEGDPGRLVLVTDLQRAGWDDEPRAVLPSALDLQIRDVGGPSANVAVLNTRVQPSAVVVSIRNSGGTPFSGPLHLAMGGSEVASTTVTVPADSTVDATVKYRAPSSGVLTVAVDDSLGYPADNRRIVLLDPRVRPRVLVVVSATTGAGGGLPSSSGFYLVRVLDASVEEASGFEPTVIDGAALARLDPQELRRYAAVAMLSTRSLDRRAREALIGFVRGGGGLIASAGPELDASLLAGLLGAQPHSSAIPDSRPRVLAVTDLRHPIFRPFGPLTANLGQVRFDRAWRMSPEGWNVAATFTDGTPALLERQDGTGRVLLFTSDLDRRWNDFPLHPAFVPFVLESVRYAAGTRASSRELTIGEAPAGVEQTPGVHALPDGRQVVLNVDTRESAPSKVTAQEFADMLQRVESSARGAASLRAQQTEARQSYWQYGLVLMLLALIAESVVGRVP